jgi:lysophospholipase L1-like esterase
MVAMTAWTQFRIGAVLLSVGLFSACTWLKKEVGPQPPAAGFMLKSGDTIVFLGDSITQGASGPQGYVTLFNLFCSENGYEVKSINAGISGHKSNDMLKRLQKDVLNRHPAWVSVSCGVNDVWHGVKGVPLADYKKNMTEIVDRCTAAGAKVLLLTATPIMEDINGPFNQKAVAYNDFLRQLAKKKRVVLCDLNKAFTEAYRAKKSKENLLTTDGVHMKPSGYRLWATETLKALGASPDEIGKAEKRWNLQGKP